MSLSRRLPNSNITRLEALSAAKKKLLSSNPEDLILSDNIVDRLNNMYFLYSNAYSERIAAFGDKASYSNAIQQNRKALQMYLSHFIQVFNLGIERNEHPVEHRSFYGLPINNQVLPNLKSEASVLLWSNNLVAGDAKRLEAGGLPMSNPSIAQIITATKVLSQNIALHNAQEDVCNKAQSALDDLNPEADKVILRLWNEIAVAYDNLDAPARRRKSREWGVMYTNSTSSFNLMGTVLNYHNNEPIAKAKVHLVEADSSVKTNKQGAFLLKTNLSGIVTLAVEKLGFVTEIQQLILVDNEDLETAILLKKPQ